MYQFLEVKNLSKYFGGLAAVENLTFQLDKEEIVGLIGPNGSGKTTLFSLITGFLTPSRGEIRFKGHSILGLRPHEIVKRGITKTFQIPKPFHSLTCFENVLVSMLSKFINPRREGRLIEEKSQEILEIVGLQGKRELLPEALTQGNLKQLEIAKVLATGPELLLLDEPFAGLTLEEISRLTSLIQTLQGRGLTLIIVEHKLRELMKIVQRVIVLDFGKKVADGSPKEISHNKKVIEAYLGSGGYSLGSV